MAFKSIFELIEHQKRYTRKNRLKQKERSRRHYLENRPAYLLRSKRQRAASPAKIKEYHRLRYQRKKEQVKKRMSEYYKRNAEKVKARVRKHTRNNLLRIREEQKKTYEKYRLKYMAQKREYYWKNRGTLLAKQKEWRRKNPDKARAGVAKFYKKRPEAKIAHRFRLRLNKILGSKKPKDLTVFNLFGCSYETLRRHIEKQFKPGMSWDNRGKKWHVDHIVPISLYEKDDLISANHYSNLRPMFASDNISRGNRLKGYFVIRGKRVIEHSD